MFPHHDNELAQAEAFHDCSQVQKILLELDILYILEYISVRFWHTHELSFVAVGEFFHTFWTSFNRGFEDVKISEELHNYQRCMYFS
jgi:hypothetical protein